mmetsp:Transcript_58055/g.96271  ORF Transcript_58055/g.96271 Transcript_58055/m.96271 type:complete len:292 (-) Transcript_58055:256-1131(-)
MIILRFAIPSKCMHTMRITEWRMHTMSVLLLVQMRLFLHLQLIDSVLQLIHHKMHLVNLFQYVLLLLRHFIDILVCIAHRLIKPRLLFRQTLKYLTQSNHRQHCAHSTLKLARTIKLTHAIHFLSIKQGLGCSSHPFMLQCLRRSVSFARILLQQFGAQIFGLCTHSAPILGIKHHWIAHHSTTQRFRIRTRIKIVDCSSEQQRVQYTSCRPHIARIIVAFLGAAPNLGCNVNIRTAKLIQRLLCIAFFCQTKIRQFECIGRQTRNVVPHRIRDFHGKQQIFRFQISVRNM